MEPEGSLPHSQVSATCPSPEPARSSLYPHTVLLLGITNLTTSYVTNPSKRASVRSSRRKNDIKMNLGNTSCALYWFRFNDDDEHSNCQETVTVGPMQAL
jgi:hypothetical protein